MNGDVSGEHDTLRELITVEEQEDAALQVVRHAEQQLGRLAGEFVRTDSPHFSDNFLKAVQLFQQCAANDGMVVTTGVGKSALMAQRLAATLNVVGVPARYLCPVAALHGDLGSVGRADVLVAISRGGETGEVLRLVAAWNHQRWNRPIVVLTSQQHAYLCRYGKAVLVYPGDEADEEGLAPTTSNTVVGVLGDMLAMAVQRTSTRTPEDFAAIHPEGTLGRRLTCTAREVMVKGEDVGRIPADAILLTALNVLAEKRGTLVVEQDDKFVGVLTTGDLARWVSTHPMDGLLGEVSAVMNEKPCTCQADTLVSDAIEQMQAHKIMALPVFWGERGVVGMLHLHDALRAGVL